MHDLLADFLATLQLQSTVYCQSEIHKADWRLHFHAVRGGAFHILREGCCWLVHRDGQQVMEQGDLVVLPHGDEHWVADQPGAPLCAEIYPELEASAGCQLMRWGDQCPGTVLVCGLFRFHEFNNESILAFLPPLLHFRAHDIARSGLQPTITALIEEANAERQGKHTVLHRLADILFVQLVRAWVADPTTEAQGWLAGLRDPQITAALAAIHRDPARAWTVQGLASQAAMSRSAFAARFSEVVGLSPFEYLTQWRMQLARPMLEQPSLSIEQVAERVGYASEIAFSRAFKRIHRVSPSAYRRSLR